MPARKKAAKKRKTTAKRRGQHRVSTATRAKLRTAARKRSRRADGTFR